MDMPRRTASVPRVRIARGSLSISLEFPPRHYRSDLTRSETAEYLAARRLLIAPALHKYLVDNIVQAWYVEVGQTLGEHPGC